MNRFLLLIIFLCTISAIQAREVSGRVLAESDSAAVEGAVCRLVSVADSMAGVTTDSQGEFSLTLPDKTEATLEVSMTGFAPAEILLSAAGGNINLGDIYLPQADMLGEVTVTAERVIDSQGRFIVFPSQSQIKSSSSAIELFQKLPLPGLNANPLSRTLSVDGRSPVILIDGVPSTIHDVYTLRPSDIAKVEFSRFTPARYADRNVNGVVSITLRKRTDGGSVFLWGRGGLNATNINGTLASTYHQGPSQFKLSYNPYWINTDNRVYDKSESAYIADDFSARLKEESRSPFNALTNRISASYTYVPSAKTSFAATFTTSHERQKNHSEGHTDDTVLGEYDNRLESGTRVWRPSLDLFLHHDFNEKNSIEVEVVGSLAETDYRYNNHYVYEAAPSAEYTSDVDGTRHSLISEVIYTHTFSNRTSLQAGYQNTVSHNRNRYLDSDGYAPLLTDNNNYLYASLSQQLGQKVNVNVSTGAKLFWMKNDLNRRHFIRNNTSAQLNYNISPKWSAMAYFSYSSNIPSLSALTDYPQQATPYLVRNGNPQLKACDVFLYRAMATYQHKKVSVTALGAYADFKNNIINDVSYLGNRLFMAQYRNMDKSEIFAGSLMLSVDDLAGFGGKVNLAVFHYHNAIGAWSRRLTSLDANLTLWWTKGPFTASYTRSFPGKQLAGYGATRGEDTDILDLSYRLGRHWTFGASWWFILRSNGATYKEWSYSPVNPSQTTRHIKDDANMVTLTVTYTADFGSLFRSGRRSLNNSDSGSTINKL